MQLTENDNQTPRMVLRRQYRISAGVSTSFGWRSMLVGGLGIVDRVASRPRQKIKCELVTTGGRPPAMARMPMGQGEKSGKGVLSREEDVVVESSSCF